MIEFTQALKAHVLQAVSRGLNTCPTQNRVQEAVYKQLPPEIATAVKSNPEYYPEEIFTVEYYNPGIAVVYRLRGVIGPLRGTGNEVLRKLGLYDELLQETVEWNKRHYIRSDALVTLSNMMSTYIDVGIFLRDFPEFESIIAPHVDLSTSAVDCANDLRRTLVPMLKSHGWRKTE